MYYCCSKNLQKAKQLNDIVGKLIGTKDFISSPAYEGYIWCKAVLSFDLEFLNVALESAKSRKSHETSAFLLYVIFLISIAPEIKLGLEGKKICATKKLLSGDMINFLIYLLGELEESIKLAGHHQTKEGRRTYDQLIENGLNCMRYWILGEPKRAASHVTKATLQSSLIKIQVFGGWIPTYFAAFVAFQLTCIGENLIDECEICCNSLMVNIELRWISHFVEYLSNAINLEYSLNPLNDIKELYV